MPHLRQTVLSLAVATAAVGAWAQTAAQLDAQQKQHQAHVLATEQSSAPASGDKAAAMDNKMKAMAEMHQKMMAAKTPEENKALMAEHMKTMQEGMKAMGMKGGEGMAVMPKKEPMAANMEERHRAMEKRLDMLEMMMQMAMDRMATPAR